MVEIAHDIRASSMVESTLCSLMASYTFISILDHERWMKELRDEHEAFGMMHLQMPILSAAVTLGIGGITTVHHIALAAIDLDGVEHRASGWFIILSAFTAVVAMFSMLFIARKDVFADIDRVDRLKDVVMSKYTITELKNRKGLGTRVAYAQKLEHVLGAGIILGTGIFGCWCIGVAGMVGDFVIVWQPWFIVALAVYQLALGLISTLILFRLLVWKPANEIYRLLCALFMAVSGFSINYLGKAHAIHFEGLDGRTPNGNFGWSMETDTLGSELLFVCVLGAIATQYAIALELRVAYCGLQDANFDLQLMTDVGSTDNIAHKSSAALNTTRRLSAQGNRKLARPRRRASTVAPPVSTSAAAGNPTSSFARLEVAGNRDTELDTSRACKTRKNLRGTSGAVSAANRLAAQITMPSLHALRNTRVQPVDQGKNYESTTNAAGGGSSEIDEEQLTGAIDGQRAGTSEPREVLRPKDGGAVGGVGPPQKLNLPSDPL